MWVVSVAVQGQDEREINHFFAQYDGFPYAISAALNMLVAGVALESLPADPHAVAGAQFTALSQNGSDAIKLIKAYAILEVGVPPEVARRVAGLDSNEYDAIIAQPYVKGLLRRDGEGERLHHAIFADEVLSHIPKEDESALHHSAIEVYRKRLRQYLEKQERPDDFSAERLTEHALDVLDPKAAATVLCNECFPILYLVGALDAAISLSERVIRQLRTQTGDAESDHLATVLGNLGLIYKTRGELDEAEKMVRKSLAIEEKLGRLEGMASDYSNLAGIYQTRGDLDEARQLWIQSRDLCQRIGTVQMVQQLQGWIDKLPAGDCNTSDDS